MLILIVYKFLVYFESRRDSWKDGAESAFDWEEMNVIDIFYRFFVEFFECFSRVLLLIVDNLEEDFNLFDSFLIG